MPQTEFSHETDNETVERIPESEKNLVVIHALIISAREPKEISNLFPKEAHQENFSFTFLFQNVFSQGGELRTIRVNENYLVVYKNT